MYDIIVIGSGLAGLHSAYSLQSHTKNICILEKDCRIGGRILTVNHEGMRIEAGAGRFNGNHTLLMYLIQSLGLISSLTKIPSDLIFVPSKHTYEKRPEYVGKTPFSVLNRVLQKMKRVPKRELLSYTFIDYVKEKLCKERENISKTDVDFILDSFGYYEQLIHMNAYHALKLFDEGMHTKHQFYGLKGGMSQIVERLCERITCPIHTNQAVQHIEYMTYCQTPHFLIHVEGRKMPYKAKYCIGAIPKLAMERIPLFRVVQPTLDCIGVKILCRIYAKFPPEENTWLEHIRKTTINNNSRYIIPIDRSQGWIMIAYTDSKYAEYWKKKSDDYDGFWKALKKNLEDALSGNENTKRCTISEPTFLRAFYWETGTSFWKPGCDGDIESDKMVRPIASMPLFVCGENISTCQGWMEGALETSEVAVKALASEASYL
jgi:monoamine oxidase